LARRLATAGLQLVAAMMTHIRAIRRYTQAKLGVLYCTSQSCYSPAAEASRRRGQLPWHHGQALVKNNERRRGNRPRHHGQVPATRTKRRRGKRPGHHVQVPARRRGQRPGAMIKFLRRTTSVATGNGLGTAIK
jgi:hypothetical protein